MWKDVVGYEKYFMVSNNGEVFSKRTGKVLKQGVSKAGYRVLSSKIGGRKGKYIYIRVHRMVAEAFIKNPENKPHVNHKNRNKQDNRVDNLEWVTYEENMEHFLENRTESDFSRYRNIKTVIPKEKIKEVRELYKPYCRVFGARALGRKYGVTHNTILKYINKDIVE